MDCPGVVLVTEIIQRKKENIVYFHLHVESKIKKKKNKDRLTDTKNKLMVTKGEGVGGWQNR